MDAPLLSVSAAIRDFLDDCNQAEFLLAQLPVTRTVRQHRQTTTVVMRTVLRLVEAGTMTFRVLRLLQKQFSPVLRFLRFYRDQLQQQREVINVEEIGFPVPRSQPAALYIDLVGDQPVAPTPASDSDDEEVVFLGFVPLVAPRTLANPPPLAAPSAAESESDEEPDDAYPQADERPTLVNPVPLAERNYRDHLAAIAGVPPPAPPANPPTVRFRVNADVLTAQEAALAFFANNQEFQPRMLRRRR